MDFRQLRYFVAVAECGSINAAASRLHVAQSAISRQLQRLEERLGCELFVRSVAGVKLTDSGALLLERARFILQEVENTADDVSTFSEEIRGTVRMAAIASIGQAIFVPLVKDYMRRYPMVQLEIGELTSPDVVHRLTDGVLDLGIVTNPGQHDHLEFSPLLREGFILIGPHGDGPRRNVTMAQAMTLPLILPAGLHRVFKRRYADLDPKLKIEGSVTIAELVREGFGHAILPRSALVTARAAFDGLPTVAIDGLYVDRMLAMVRGRPKSLALRAFMVALLDQVRRGIAEGVFEAP